MKPHEISINVTIKLVLGGWMEDGSLVHCRGQISDNPLDSFCMTCFGVVGVTILSES